MAKNMKSEVLKYTLMSKNVLSVEEMELYELTHMAGITVDPEVFKIILDLLKLNIAPTAVYQVLNSMSSQQRKKGDQPKSASNSKIHNSGSSGIRQKSASKGRQPNVRPRPDHR